MAQRTYLAIDLKSYYASAECAARHLDPMTTNLVVADASRTEKTICLAVSPSLKSYGIPGRARLFEVVQRVKEVNNGRLRDAIRNKTAVYKDGVGSYKFRSLLPTLSPNLFWRSIFQKSKHTLVPRRIFQTFLPSCT